MKTLLTSVLFFFATVPAVLAQTTQFIVDQKASRLNWTGYAEVGSWAPSGTIQLQKGQLTRTGDQIRGGQFVINMATLQHDDNKLQTHLRGDDFFNVVRYPTASFVLNSLTNSTATGQLTIRGVTKPVSFPVSVRQESDELRISGTAVVDRTQFGVRYNSSSFFSGLGDYAIKNEFALTFNVVAKVVSSVLPVKRNPAR